VDRELLAVDLELESPAVAVRHAADVEPLLVEDDVLQPVVDRREVVHRRAGDRPSGVVDHDIQAQMVQLEGPVPRRMLRRVRRREDPLGAADAIAPTGFQRLGHTMPPTRWVVRVTRGST